MFLIPVVKDGRGENCGLEILKRLDIRVEREMSGNGEGVWFEGLWRKDGQDLIAHCMSGRGKGKLRIFSIY